MSGLKEIVDFVFKKNGSGMAVIITVTTENGRQGLEEHLAEVVGLLCANEVPCTVAIIANEPVIGVVGIPVVTLNLYPSLESIEVQSDGTGAERGYQ